MSQENLNNDPANPSPIVPPVEPTEGNDRIKKDMLKYKDEAERLKAQVEEMKLKGHKEKEDWKTVAEHHEQKAKEFEQKYSGLQNALVHEKKIRALTDEAQKHGINPASLADLELLDFDEVSVETTSAGKILVTGQDRAIAKLKTLRPHWFQNTVPSVNPSSPNVGRPTSDGVTVADLNAAEAQYRKTKSESDKQAYFDLIKKYKSQHGA
jgi:hypothetical protein